MKVKVSDNQCKQCVWLGNKSVRAFARYVNSFDGRRIKRRNREDGGVNLCQFGLID